MNYSRSTVVHFKEKAKHGHKFPCNNNVTYPVPHPLIKTKIVEFLILVVYCHIKRSFSY